MDGNHFRTLMCMFVQLDRGMDSSCQNVLIVFFLGDKIIKRNATFFTKRYTALVNVCNGAGDGNRTHDISLEGWSFTIKLHPHK
jgi:hypothetical protein